jgi:hypothetical protein
MHCVLLHNKIASVVGWNNQLLHVFHLFVKPWHLCHSFATQDDRFYLIHVENMAEAADTGPNELQEDMVLECGDVAAESGQEVKN